LIDCYEIEGKYLLVDYEKYNWPYAYIIKEQFLHQQLNFLLKKYFRLRGIILRNNLIEYDKAQKVKNGSKSEAATKQCSKINQILMK
jgi:hypothetical protein